VQRGGGIPMICDQCHKRDATIHVTQAVNGETQEMNLCAGCAMRLGFVSAGGDLSALPFLEGLSFPAGLFKVSLGSPVKGGTAVGERCIHCGLTFDEFRSGGRMGCGRCYAAFAHRLLPLMKRIQSGDRHTGLRPTGATARVMEQDAAREAREAREAAARESRPEAPPTVKSRPRVRPGPPAGPPQAGSADAAPESAGPAEPGVPELREELRKAVDREDYESAARLRDRIRALSEPADTPGEKDREEKKGGQAP